MPVLILSALSRPSGRSFLLLIGILVVLPGLVSYWTLSRSAASYNVCFVGPASSDYGPFGAYWGGGDGDGGGGGGGGDGWDDDEVTMAGNALGIRGSGAAPGGFRDHRLYRAADAHRTGGGSGGGTAEEEEGGEEGTIPGAGAASSDRLRRRRREALSDLYGTYRTFDGASYYYVKTPFDVTPSCAFSSRRLCGWPSASGLARVLSPRGVRRAEERWRSSAKEFLEGRTGSFRRGGHGGGPGTLSDREYDDEGLPTKAGGRASVGRGGRIRRTADAVSASIGWDRGGPSPLSRGLNRWCLSSTYLPDGPSEPPVKIKICTPEVPSIVVSSDGADAVAAADAASAAAGGVPNVPKPPPDDLGFPELPLSPPPNGIWSVEEVSEVEGMGYGAYRPVNGGYGDSDGMEAVMDMDDSSSAAPRGMKVRVHCHQNRRRIGTAAGGRVELGPWDERRGGMAPRVEWNLLRLPATALLMALCCLSFYRSTKLTRMLRRGGSSGAEASESLLRARAVSYNRVASHPPSELWRCYAASFHHPSFAHLALVLWNLHWIGAALEEDYGTLPYLYLHISAIALVSVLTLVLVRLQIALKIGVERGTDPVHLRTRAALIGYLPVLLAWSVVAAAERPALRPLPDVEVPTLVFLGGAVKFNALPAFVLVLAQCLAPKSAAVSHVAGGLVGLIALHWGVPPFGMTVPQALIPVGLLLHWTFARTLERRRRRAGYSRVFAFAPEDDLSPVDSVPPPADLDGDSAAGVPQSPAAEIRRLSRAYDNDGPVNPSGIGGVGGGAGVGGELRPLGSGERIALLLLRLLHVAVALLSLVAFDHGAALGQLAVSILFHHSVAARLASVSDALGSANTSASRCSDARAALRYHFLSSSILLITDAASVGAWVVTRVFVLSDPTVLLDSAFWIFAAATARMAMNLAGLVLSAAALGRGDESTDLLGPAFRLAEEAGAGMLSVRMKGLCRRRGGEDEDDEEDDEEEDGMY